MKRITLLGSTGSVGISTLDVIAQHPDDFCVVALTAHKNVELLWQQCLRHRPKYAVLANEQLAEDFNARLRNTALDITLCVGRDALRHVATLAEADVVVSAIVGAAGLLPTMAAIQAGKCVLLANKEALVMSGQLLMNEVLKHRSVLLPLDSEHNAIFQCLSLDAQSNQSSVSKIILTASGGSVRDRPLDTLSQVKPEEACRHPNWKMGQKISVDSATMMNKGFELIETRWLFDFPAEKIEVVLHPQSLVHALVEYIDGSVLAHLANPDMRIAIAHALAWPKRMMSQVGRLDLLKQREISFYPLDLQRYPCFDLARQALNMGGTAATILNASNEIAVQAFLDREIAFTDIARLNAHVLEKLSFRSACSLDVILEDDLHAREVTTQLLNETMESVKIMV